VADDPPPVHQQVRDFGASVDAPVKSPTTLAAPHPFRKLYWRMLFWVVAIHSVLGAVPLAMNTAGESPDAMFWIFPAKEIGIVRAITLWLAENPLLTSWAMLLADVAAVGVLWTVVRGRVKTKPIVLYFAFTFFVGLLKVVPAFAEARAGVVRTSHATYVFSAEEVYVAWVTALMLGFPALLLVAGRIVVGWSTFTLGLCSSCGYDLRASIGRCPECGMRIPLTINRTEA
jgi:hypothetical protein